MLSSNGAVGRFANGKLYIGSISRSLQFEGNFDLLTGIAIVVNVHSRDFVISGDTLHGIGVQNNTVQSKLQHIFTNACHLEFGTVTVDQVSCTRNFIIQNALTTPTGQAISTGTGILILGFTVNIFIDNAECITIAGIHSNAHRCREAAIGASFHSICLIHIVLDHDSQGFILTVNGHSPGVIIRRIISIQNAVSLVSVVPSSGAGCI